ncbi:MAG: hypothetical protein R2771_03050 [Saprospiraceae bacterium]
MKKILIGTIVGGILLFFLQFLSWGLLNIHRSEMSYTDKQDAVIEFLSENLHEGNYYIPLPAPGSSNEEAELEMKESVGRPWAMIQYHESMEYNMGLNMIRGLVVDLLAVFVLIWFLMKFSVVDFKNSVLGALAVGFIGYLTVNYTNAIWFEADTWAALLDVVVQWGIVGSWLGFWLGRK